MAQEIFTPTHIPYKPSPHIGDLEVKGAFVPRLCSVRTPAERELHFQKQDSTRRDTLISHTLISVVNNNAEKTQLFSEPGRPLQGRPLQELYQNDAQNKSKYIQIYTGVSGPGRGAAAWPPPGILYISFLTIV